MRPRDTSADAWEAFVAHHRSLSPAERLGRGLAMIDDVERIAASAVRRRHPEYSEDEVEWALRRNRVGDELFHAAWPAAPLLPL